MGPGRREGWGSNPSSETSLGLSEPLLPPHMGGWRLPGLSWNLLMPPTGVRPGAGACRGERGPPGPAEDEEADHGCPGPHASPSLVFSSSSVPGQGSCSGDVVAPAPADRVSAGGGEGPALLSQAVGLGWACDLRSGAEPVLMKWVSLRLALPSRLGGHLRAGKCHRESSRGTWHGPRLGPAAGGAGMPVEC